MANDGFAPQMSTRRKRRNNSPPIPPQKASKSYSGTKHTNLAVYLAGEKIDTVSVGREIDQSNWPNKDESKSWGNVDKATHYKLNFKYDQLNRWCPGGINLKEYKGITAESWQTAIDNNLRPVAIKKKDRAHVEKSDYGYMFSRFKNVCQSVGFTKGINTKTTNLISRDLYDSISTGSGIQPDPTVVTSLRNLQGEVQSVVLEIGSQLYLAPKLVAIEPFLHMFIRENASGWEGPPPVDTNADETQEEDGFIHENAEPQGAAATTAPNNGHINPSDLLTLPISVGYRVPQPSTHNCDNGQSSGDASENSNDNRGSSGNSESDELDRDFQDEAEVINLIRQTSSRQERVGQEAVASVETSIFTSNPSVLLKSSAFSGCKGSQNATNVSGSSADGNSSGVAKAVPENGIDDSSGSAECGTSCRDSEAIVSSNENIPCKKNLVACEKPGKSNVDLIRKNPRRNARPNRKYT